MRLRLHQRTTTFLKARGAPPPRVLAPRLRAALGPRALACAALLIASWSGCSVTAQTPAKRPLSYDVYDYWRSIQGTALSRDGEWLAYALTSEGEDGELVVRNLRTATEFKHPRGINPAFTADGKFVVFTIAQTKAEEEKERRGKTGGSYVR